MTSVGCSALAVSPRVGEGKRPGGPWGAHRVDGGVGRDDAAAVATPPQTTRRGRRHTSAAPQGRAAWPRAAHHGRPRAGSATGPIPAGCRLPAAAPCRRPDRGAGSTRAQPVQWRAGLLIGPRLRAPPRGHVHPANPPHRPRRPAAAGLRRHGTNGTASDRGAQATRAADGGPQPAAGFVHAMMRLRLHVFTCLRQILRSDGETGLWG